MPDDRSTPTDLTTRLVAGAVLAGLTAANWYAWLGWDHEYQTDPRTGELSGPYETWQVAGCGIVLLALALFAAIRVTPLLPLLVMPMAFTVVWSVDAAQADDTGLWGVGALMLLFGLSFAGFVVAVLARAIRGRPRADTPLR